MVGVCGKGHFDVRFLHGSMCAEGMGKVREVSFNVERHSAVSIGCASGAVFEASVQVFGFVNLWVKLGVACVLGVCGRIGRVETRIMCLTAHRGAH